MKLTHRLLLISLAAAIALPCATFAAKPERKKKNATPAATFASVDKDNDGAISEAEFLAAEKDRGTVEAAKARFAAMDKNADGKIAKDEFTGLAEEPKIKKKKKKNQN